MVNLITNYKLEFCIYFIATTKLKKASQKRLGDATMLLKKKQRIKR